MILLSAGQGMCSQRGTSQHLRVNLGLLFLLGKAGELYSSAWQSHRLPPLGWLGLWPEGNAEPAPRLTHPPGKVEGTKKGEEQEFGGNRRETGQQPLVYFPFLPLILNVSRTGAASPQNTPLPVAPPAGAHLHSCVYLSRGLSWVSLHRKSISAWGDL